MSRRDEKAGAKGPLAGVKARLDRALDAMESPAGDSKVLPVGALRGMLSLFSVPAENRPDPIPNTNVLLGALYVLGALAALIFAIVDPSCEEVTAYRTDAPIEQCTTMLASFSCRTKDYNRTTGAGYSKVFDASSCLQGRNETVESFAAHPAATCGAMKEAIFPCHTADYDKQNNTGLQSSMARDACPAAPPHFKNTEVTGAHAPSVCAALKEAKFSCVTRDFDADAGAGHEWSDFTPTYCPSEEDTEYIEVRDVYPLSLYPCEGFIDESFECQTEDYDDAGAGVRRTFDFSACPYERDWLGAGAFADVEVPGVHSPGRYLFKETSFSCQTADYDEAAGTGYKRTCDKTASVNGNCPEQLPIIHANGTLAGYTTVAYISAEDDWPAEECRNFDEYYSGAGITCKTADYDAAAGTGGIKTFPAHTCAYTINYNNYDPVSIEFGYTSNGTAPVLGWYDVSLCSDLSEDTVTCRTSSCGTNVDGSVTEGGGIDEAYYYSDLHHGYGSSPYATCRECFEDEDADTSSFPCTPSCISDAGTPEICREAFGLCCGPKPSWYTDRTHNRLNDWLGNRLGNRLVDPNTAADFEMQMGGKCPDGSMTDRLQSWQCAATGETACACPSADYATGRQVDRASCNATMALNSYTACGTACGKTYDPSTSTWDSVGDAFDFFSGGVAVPAFDSSGNVEFTYQECFGTHPEANVTFATCRGTKRVQVEWASCDATALVPTAFDTCNGTRSVPIEFETCYGTRDMSVQFATCEGTQDLPVSYELCDGFVVVCPQTPTSVRFSQAMAYASTWMGALAGAYAFLSNRAMQKAAPAKEEEAGRGEEEAAPRAESDGEDDSGTSKVTVASRV